MDKNVILQQFTAEELVNLIAEAVLEKIESKVIAEEFWDSKKVEKFLSIERSTLERYVKEGFLVKYGIGRQVRYKRSEVEKALVAFRGLYR